MMLRFLKLSIAKAVLSLLYFSLLYTYVASLRCQIFSRVTSKTRHNPKTDHFRPTFSISRVTKSRQSRTQYLVHLVISVLHFQKSFVTQDSLSEHVDFISEYWSFLQGFYHFYIVIMTKLNKYLLSTTILILPINTEHWSVVLQFYKIVCLLILKIIADKKEKRDHNNYYNNVKVKGPLIMVK